MKSQVEPSEFPGSIALLVVKDINTDEDPAYSSCAATLVILDYILNSISCACFLVVYSITLKCLSKCQLDVNFQKAFIVEGVSVK